VIYAKEGSREGAREEWGERPRALIINKQLGEREIRASAVKLAPSSASPLFLCQQDVARGTTKSSDAHIRHSSSLSPSHFSLSLSLSLALTGASSLPFFPPARLPENSDLRIRTRNVIHRAPEGHRRQFIPASLVISCSPSE
jgi:hypothetical protein